MSKNIYILGDSVLDSGTYGFKCITQNHQTIGPAANLNLGEFLCYKLLNKVPNPYYQCNTLINNFFVIPGNTNFAVIGSTFAPPVNDSIPIKEISTQINNFICSTNINNNDSVLIDGGLNDFNLLLKQCINLQSTNDPNQIISFFNNVNLLFPGYDPARSIESILIIINDYLINGILPIIKNNFDKILSTNINKLVYLDICLNPVPNITYYPPILQEKIYLLSEKNDILTEKIFQQIQKIMQLFNISLKNYYKNNDKLIFFEYKIAIELIIYDIFVNKAANYGIVNYTDNTVPVLLDTSSNDNGFPLYGFINSNDSFITPFITNNPINWKDRPIISQVSNIPITGYNGLYSDMYHLSSLGNQIVGNIIFTLLRKYL